MPFRKRKHVVKDVGLERPFVLNFLTRCEYTVKSYI